MAISFVDAQGGTGKTRFAIELCRKLSGYGWVAGLLPRRDRGISGAPLPRLVVVDYVEERDAADLAEQLAALARSATPMSPVRVLLLSRPTAGQSAGAGIGVLVAQSASTGQVMLAVEAAEGRSAAVRALSRPERDRLFDTGLAAFGRDWFGAGWTPPNRRVDLSSDRYARPLDVLLEAFDAALSGPEWHAARLPPVDRVLDHEERHWRARVTDIDPRLLRR